MREAAGRSGNSRLQRAGVTTAGCSEQEQHQRAAVADEALAIKQQRKKLQLKPSKKLIYAN